MLAWFQDDENRAVGGWEWPLVSLGQRGSGEKTDGLNVFLPTCFLDLQAGFSGSLGSCAT